MIRVVFFLAATSLLFVSCQTNRSMGKEIHNVPLAGTGVLDIQGHRGCRGLMPENTVPAMLHALSEGVNTLEMDVVITKDGEPILSHEPFFSYEITTSPNGNFIKEIDQKDLNIYRMSYAEVAKYDVGLKPNDKFPEQQKLKISKPLLSAVIDSVNAYMLTRKRPTPFYNIETKSSPETDGIFHPVPAAFVESIMTVVKAKGIASQVIIQSFDIRTLQYLHQKYPEIKTALLIDELDQRSFRKQITDLGFDPSIYSPSHGLVNPVLIKNCHDKNIRIIPWTVNDKSRMSELIKMGVDGIITDYPDRIPK